MSAQKRFTAAGEQDAGFVGVDRLACRLDAIDCQRAIEQGFCGISGKILDRETGDAGFHRARDVYCDLVRLVCKAGQSEGGSAGKARAEHVGPLHHDAVGIDPGEVRVEQFLNRGVVALLIRGRELGLPAWLGRRRLAPVAAFDRTSRGRAAA